MTWLRSHYLRDVVVRKPEETKQNKEEVEAKKTIEGALIIDKQISAVET